MMKKNCYSVILLFCYFNLFTPALLQAQELNASVSVNSARIEGSNKDVFTSLQTQLKDFLNTRRWSAATVSPTERIECSFAIEILTASREGFYQAALTVSAKRPVYNSTYTTALIYFRDTEFEFEYEENAPIEYVEHTLNNNLVATIAFYSYLILGLDFDSFAPMGGTYFFRQARNIATQAQSNSGWIGWAPFAKPNNRHAIITAFTDESLNAFRELWYTYHRKGLDEMATNPDRGRTNILNALPVLKQLNDVRSSSVMLQMFADAKLDEIVLISSKATPEQKKEVYDLLYSLFPTMSNRLEPLRK
ncbi:MAG: DUF4835 family protein [Dysgonamonadaceae bacterium]|jgi:hypothetical protein|nr:DUF4835 family protein [Dysgonamonadaceae bacterium]